MVHNHSLVVIFGGTGDLTHRKLLPAFYTLFKQGQLDNQFAIVIVGRRPWDTAHYIEEAKQSILKFAPHEFELTSWEKFAPFIHYYELDFTKSDGYAEFNDYLDGMNNRYHTGFNILFYLAVAPEFFVTIANSLQHVGLHTHESGWRRVVIEKPFGHDLTSAKSLNEQITSVFGEQNTYRIDHYLGKEMIQNILVLRFANQMFASVWNNKAIDHIQILASETLGVETRGHYYDQVGAIRDMVQSHLLQILMMIGMEMPMHLDADAIRSEKAKVLKSLRPIFPDEVKDYVVRAQYQSGNLGEQKVIGYHEEEKVDPQSTTETFVALKAFIDNPRWQGVPFYLRTGKRLPTKSVEVIITFKPLSQSPFLNQIQKEPNRLVIRIQPTEGVYVQFNAKKLGNTSGITPVQMDFCQNCVIGFNSPEAYERLLLDAMKGDATLFASWEEVYLSWHYIESILQAWKDNAVPLYYYDAGSKGPKEAELLIQTDGHQWLDL